MHGKAVERPRSGIARPVPHANCGDLRGELEPYILHEENEQPKTNNVNRHF